MSTISIYTTFMGRVSHVRTVEAAALMNVSCDARNTFAGQTGHKQLDIVGIPPAALNSILTQAFQSGAKVRIDIANKGFINVVRLLQAIIALDLEPTQPHVEGFVVHQLANKKIEPAQMVLIDDAFGHLGAANKPWRVMVDQIAWDVRNNENHTGDEIKALSTEAQKHPALHSAIGIKVAELDQRKKEGLAKAAARKQAAEERKQQAHNNAQAHAPQNRRRAEQKTRACEADEQYWFEEQKGLCQTSDETAEYMMKSKVGSYYFGPPKPWKQLKKPGQGAGQDGAKSGDGAGAETEADGDGDVAEKGGDEDAEEQASVELSFSQGGVTSGHANNGPSWSDL